MVYGAIYGIVYGIRTGAPNDPSDVSCDPKMVNRVKLTHINDGNTPANDVLINRNSVIDDCCISIIAWPFIIFPIIHNK